MSWDDIRLIAIFAVAGLSCGGISLFIKKRIYKTTTPALVSWPFLGWSIFILTMSVLITKGGESLGGGTEATRQFHAYVVLLLGMLIVMLLGIFDDKKHIAGKVKLPVLIISWVFPALFMAVSHWNIHLRASIFYLIILALLSCAALCSMPLIDGINGLFIGHAMITALFLVVGDWLDFIRLGPFFEEFTGAIYPWAGLMMGFFVWNFPTARLRLGEAAVLTSSYWITTWIFLSQVHHSMKSYSADVPIDYFVPWLFIPLLYPIIDLFLLMINRTRNRRSVFAPGHDHLHHRLIQLGNTPAFATIKILFAVMFCCLGVLSRFVWLYKPESTGLRLKKHYSYNDLMPMQNGLSILWISIFFTPLAYLFWRGYTKVNPYKSGAVDERGRP
jgi:UDP-N-acetylmuramyl pentapeptide phosphotransferase/UDP-N-acetylglucosamine-1-phosphate transferase